MARRRLVELRRRLERLRGQPGGPALGVSAQAPAPPPQSAPPQPTAPQAGPQLPEAERSVPDPVPDQPAALEPPEQADSPWLPARLRSAATRAPGDPGTGAAAARRWLPDELGEG